jgi:2-oxoisovalerate dehydrogenase E2 component (dihydrolipoyl transacylase)
VANYQQFRLPDLGEGLTEGEILKWLVAPGDTVTLNQPIVEVETAKAAVEVPSPYAGVVTEVHHAEGETVDVGAPIITFDTDPGGAPVAAPAGLDAGPAQRAAEAQAAGAAADPAESATAALANARATTLSEEIPAALVENSPDDAAVEPGLIGGPAPGGRTSVLVGYGPKTTSAVRRPRKLAPQPSAAVPAQPMRISGSAVGRSAQVAAGAVAVLAKPPVRKLARDLGVDLAGLVGTGSNGTIGREDVERAAALLASARGPAASQPPAPTVVSAAVSGAPPSADREQRVPIKGVRKATAAAMVHSAFTAPHVTEWVQVDVTRTVKLVRALRKLPDYADVRIGPLLLVAKAMLVATRRHPEINSSWDEAAQEIVVKNYVNLGIAAATPRGLIVPNIKDADRLALPELARELTELTATAKAGRTPPTAMQGGTITITNVGVFGVDTGTPILNPGEAAILAFGAVRHLPWVHRGKVRPRLVTTLGVSFDHRIVDGELGSRFLADIAAVLTEPRRTLVGWS